MTKASYQPSEPSVMPGQVAIRSKAPSVEKMSLVLQHAPKTLFHFHLFLRLPTEMRLKIWRLAGNHGRIIVFDVLPSGTPFLPARWITLIPGYSVPPLLQVNKESAEECGRLYQERKCKFNGSTILFNPAVDIAYFSVTKDCLSRENPWILTEDFPRVAIDISALSHVCMPEIYIRRILDTLHDSFIHDRGRLSHYEGLKEIMFIIRSEPFATSLAQTDPSLIVRRESNDDLTKEQIFFRGEVQAEINLIIDEEPGRFGRPPNSWVGDNKPKFSFVTLTWRKAGEALVATPTVTGRRNFRGVLDRLHQITTSP